MQQKLINPYSYVGIPTKCLPKNIRKAVHKSNTRHMQKIIVDAINEVMGINLIEMQSKYRFRHICKARNMYCYYMTHYAKWTLVDIGETLGGRDHTTIIHNINLHQDLCLTDPKFNDLSSQIKKIIEWKSRFSI